MSENTRPRGVKVYPMPEEVGGPAIFGRYALLVHPDYPVQARMVHTEGVAYLVTDDKPWVWNDHDPNLKPVTLNELQSRSGDSEPVDLADWIRWHNDSNRLEANFSQVHWWATHARD